jgi:hypothetical protein
MEILIKFPTRSRPEKFRTCLDTWISHLSGKHSVTFLVNLDDDDPTVDTVLGFYGVKNTNVYIPSGFDSVRVEFVIGHPRCKHEACNMGMQGRKFDVAIVAADDMWPQVHGYDDIIASDMEFYYPGLDGSITYWDGFRPDNLQTLCVMGYNLYRRFNYFFSPCYVSLYGDTENTFVFSRLNKVTISPEWSKASGKCLIKHLHPMATGEKHDELLTKNDQYMKSDGVIFNQRQARDFDIQAPKLSILICALECRRPLLKNLLHGLYSQVFDLPNPDDVEILYYIDNMDMDLGTKRNTLMEKARGKYLCYIDDDDRITADYIPKILAAMEKDPDTIGFLQLTTYSLRTPRISRFSVDCEADKDIESNYQIREPNHLCPTRSSIAKKFPFPAKNYSEDSERSHTMTKSKVLTTGVTIEEILYIYDYRPDRTVTQVNSNRSKYKQPLTQITPDVLLPQNHNFVTIRKNPIPAPPIPRILKGKGLNLQSRHTKRPFHSNILRRK